MDTSAFVRDGYVVVRGAFDEDTARACREVVWDVLADRGISPEDRATWAPPLVRRAAEATGRAGDVYLCHPFIVHTATWPHRGTAPRMMAQPGIAVPDGFALDGSDRSPVAQAIVQGLGRPAEK